MLKKMKNAQLIFVWQALFLFFNEHHVTWRLDVIKN